MPVARVRTVFTGVAGAPYYNNLYFENVNDLSDAQAAVDLVDSAWSTLNSVLAGALIGNIESEVPIIDIPSGNITLVWATTGGVVDPTSAAEPLPWASQGLLRLSTNTFLGGRRVRGRVFIPGFTEAAQDAGIPSATTQTAIANMGATLIAPTEPTLVVYSRPRPADPDADPPVAARDGFASVVEGTTAWNKWAVLRSRRD